LRKKIFSIIIILIFIIINSGCVKLKGEFAFKKLFEDQYKKMDDPLGFEKNEKINWVYVFNDVKGVRSIGVALLKKEIVWVDISNKTEQISGLNKVIYGKIENLSEGNYKIILSQANELIAEREFVIYADTEDYYNR
jgi:hypothetical protein